MSFTLAVTLSSATLAFSNIMGAPTSASNLHCGLRVKFQSKRQDKIVKEKINAALSHAIVKNSKIQA